MFVVVGFVAVVVGARSRDDSKHKRAPATAATIKSACAGDDSNKKTHPRNDSKKKARPQTIRGRAFCAVIAGTCFVAVVTGADFFGAVLVACVPEAGFTHSLAAWVCAQTAKETPIQQ